MKQRIHKTGSRPTIILLYLKGTTDNIRKLHRKPKVQIAHKPHKTIGSKLRNPKEKIKLDNYGVYSIPCTDYGNVYIGQTYRRISARLEEYNKNVRFILTASRYGHRMGFNNCEEIANNTMHKQEQSVRPSK